MTRPNIYQVHAIRRLRESLTFGQEIDRRDVAHLLQRHDQLEIASREAWRADAIKQLRRRREEYGR